MFHRIILRYSIYTDDVFTEFLEVVRSLQMTPNLPTIIFTEYRNVFATFAEFLLIFHRIRNIFWRKKLSGKKNGIEHRNSEMIKDSEIISSNKKKLSKI